MFFFVPLLFIALPAFGQDTKLVEAAKKEGAKVVIYGSLENDTVAGEKGSGVFS